MSIRDMSLGTIPKIGWLSTKMTCSSIALKDKIFDPLPCVYDYPVLNASSTRLLGELHAFLFVHIPVPPNLPG
jgi:hypothetical protein